MLELQAEQGTEKGGQWMEEVGNMMMSMQLIHLAHLLITAVML
jgi:hypothetical protein